DSVVYRNIIHKVLSEDPDIEVVSQASNGKLAIPRIKHYRPDFVLLDQEMPEMTGLELLEYMKDNFPEVGVLMFSSKTVQGAKITVKALSLGALDFVTKPQASEDGNIKEYIKRKVVDKLKALKGYGKVKRKTVPAAAAPVVKKEIKVSQGTFDTCAIGISTGGPQALRLLLPAVNQNIDGYILIVQHMPPIFTAQLAESLNQISSLNVFEAVDGMKFEKGCVYIAPGGMHMVVEKKAGGEYCKLVDEPPELSCKPSVNYLFRSVSQLYGSKAAAVIMTGMGNDGALGMKAVSDQGGYCFCQNEESSLIYGMPSIPVREGTSRESLGIEEIAKRIEFLLGVK
ncbi:MAG: chemotaxis-specific protein-glutamate methyltransferase CheB, partial [Spirochaetia bacterium]|nr:chemotaxis-specific protein-glutamate methyltransferase CheB [Spirochaetia bacterium]